MLNGIDISSWQAGIDLSAVDADFVIVKATGGTGYTNPDFWRAADQVLECGKLLGVYHFAGDGNDGTAEQEAGHFVDVFSPYIGRAIPILDWEADATEWPVSWALEWLDRVKGATGATPWFYSYSSYINSHDCSEIAHYPLWLAAYYAGYEPMGYQDDPPIYGGLGAWSDVACYQYSSTGYIGGYDGRLDINKFYGDAGAWMAYCGQEEDMKVEELMGHQLPVDGGGTLPVWQLESWAYTHAKSASEKADRLGEKLDELEKKVEAISVSGVDVEAVAEAVANKIAKRMKA